MGAGKSKEQPLAVVNATSNTAGSAIKVLRERHPQMQVRGVVRSQDKVDSVKQSLGLTDVVVADHSNPASFEAAFHEIHTVLFSLPNTENRADITKVVAEAAEKAGVKHIVLIGVLNAQYEEYLFAKQEREAERHIEATKVHWTHLRCQPFMENFFGLAEGVKGYGKMFWPTHDGQFAPVAVSDIGALAAEISADPHAHRNKAYDVTGPELLTASDLARQMSQRLGTSVEHVNPDDATTEQSFSAIGIPHWQVVGFIEMLHAIANNKLKVVSSATKTIGKQETTFAQWFDQVAPAFGGSPPSSSDDTKKESEPQQQSQAAATEAAATAAAVGDTNPAVIPAPPRVLIVNGTSAIGAEVVKMLQSHGSGAASVRVAVRSDAKAMNFKDQGLQTVICDPDTPETVALALEGIDRVLFVVPAVEDREAVMAKYLDVVKNSSVQVVVFLSGDHMGNTDTVFGKQLQPIETRIAQLGKPYIILQPSLFNVNLLAWAQEIKESNTFTANLGETGKVRFIAQSDVALACTNALLHGDDAKMQGETFRLFGGSADTGAEIAAAFTELLGREIKYVPCDAAAMTDKLAGIGLPAWAAQGCAQLHDQYTKTDVSGYQVNQTLIPQPRTLKDHLQAMQSMFQ